MIFRVSLANRRGDVRCGRASDGRWTCRTCSSASPSTTSAAWPPTTEDPACLAEESVAAPERAEFMRAFNDAQNVVTARFMAPCASSGGAMWNPSGGCARRSLPSTATRTGSSASAGSGEASAIGGRVGRGLRGAGRSKIRAPIQLGPPVKPGWVLCLVCEFDLGPVFFGYCVWFVSLA
jgi:hypothetical protein